MDIFAIAFLLLIFIGIKPAKVNNNYIGREMTTLIKGIFAVVILFKHCREYISTTAVNGWGGHSYDILFNAIPDYTGQLMVVMFLFYSGYGIMESFKKKKSDYLNGFMSKRVLKTLVHYDIAVLLFLVVETLLGRTYSTENYVLSWTAWLSLGNSNWFVFDIIVLYILSYIGLTLCSRYKFKMQAFLWYIFSASAVLFVLMFVVKSSASYWWWDTIMTFPLGMLWSAYKDKIEHRLNNRKSYITILITVSVLFSIFYYLSHQYMYIFFIPEAMAFAILLTLFTMKFEIKSSILDWLGINAFAIYILQRLPMLMADEFGLTYSPIMYFAIILIATMLLSAIFTKSTRKLDCIVFN